MLTQSEADSIIALPKQKLGTHIFYFPLPGEALSIPLHSQNDGEEFMIDINRGKLRLTKCNYVEGFMDKWAIPAPNDKFGNTSDLYKTLQDFFGYCNVIDPPTIQKSITQRRLFP